MATSGEAKFNYFMLILESDALTVEFVRWFVQIKQSRSMLIKIGGLGKKIILSILNFQKGENRCYNV